MLLRNRLQGLQTIGLPLAVIPDRPTNSAEEPKILTAKEADVLAFAVVFETHGQVFQDWLCLVHGSLLHFVPVG